MKKKDTLQTPWSWTSNLWDWKKRYFCCSSPPGLGTLFGSYSKQIQKARDGGPGPIQDLDAPAGLFLPHPKAPSQNPSGVSQRRLTPGLLPHKGKEAELTTSAAKGGLLFLVRGPAVTLGPTSHKTITEMRGDGGET